jgi:branched-subunit amino acid permease
MPKALSVLAAVLIVLAFVFRSVVPQNLFLPGGWPLGSHWYRTSWVAFWFFLISGVVVALTAIIKVAARGQVVR